MPRLSLEEKAQKKFPLSGDETPKEKQAILSMQKAWIKMETAKAEKKAKQKQEADRKALALGRAILKKYPNYTPDELGNIGWLLSLGEDIERLSRYGYWSESEKKWRWQIDFSSELDSLLRFAKVEED